MDGVNDKARFKAWLESMDETEIVGRSGCESNCPYHTFLAELNPGLHIKVFSLHVDWWDVWTRRSVVTDRWLQSFIDAVDQIFDDEGEYTIVRAFEALNIIKEIEEEEHVNH